MSLNQLLSRRHACAEAREWAKGYPDLSSAWAACPRADWMLWLAAKGIGKPGSAAHRKLVLATCACARHALPHVKAGEVRPLAAIEVAERWARREKGVTTEQVRTAADAANAVYCVYCAADCACASAAACAADCACASAAADAANAAYCAASAASAAVYSAVYAGWQQQRATTLAELADLVRQHYPKPPVFAGGQS